MRGSSSAPEGLPPAHLRAFGGPLFAARALAFATAIPLLLRLDLRRLGRWLEPRRPAAPASPSRAELEAAVLQIDRLLRAGRPIVRSGCLVRGLTLYALLRRAGVDASLRFGMGKLADGTLAGHCWVVVDGEPLAERRDPRPIYAETCRLPWTGGTGAFRPAKP